MQVSVSSSCGSVLYNMTNEADYPLQSRPSCGRPLSLCNHAAAVPCIHLVVDWACSASVQCGVIM